jgi:hypothetical protein
MNRIASTLLLLALLGCAKPQPTLTDAQRRGMPLHPQTSIPSVVALLRSDGMKFPMDRDREWHPVRIALWRDGTLIWSEAANGEGGHPYRIAKLDGSRVDACLSRIRTSLDRLPGREMSYTVCDGDTDELRVEDGSSTYCLASWPGAHVGDDPNLVPVLEECTSILLAERTATGQLLTDLREFAFNGKP